VPWVLEPRHAHNGQGVVGGSRLGCEGPPRKIARDMVLRNILTWCKIRLLVDQAKRAIDSSFLELELVCKNDLYSVSGDRRSTARRQWYPETERNCTVSAGRVAESQEGVGRSRGTDEALHGRTRMTLTTPCMPASVVGAAISLRCSSGHCISAARSLAATLSFLLSWLCAHSSLQSARGELDFSGWRS
jgi:hypothetical protein